MAKSKKKIAAKPAKKSSALKKSVPAKKKPAAKKVVKPSPRKPVQKSKVIAKKPSKTVAKKAAKPAAKKPVAKAKPAAAKKIVKPVARIKPRVEGKAVVKPIVKSSVHPEIKKKQQDLKTRYSDTELEEFKQLIIEKLEAAKKELKYLQDQINRTGDNGTDDTENKFASADDGSSTMEREYLNQMAARQILYIDHLDKALVRIQNKTYGICRVTGS
jgi:RNA polymerase-binding transcription factor DksA